VEVYTYKQSIKGYTVQAFLNNAWRDMDKVTGQKSNHITNTFKPVQTDRIRLLITATNGPSAIVTEIEAYEK
jgi:hypothetical protein